MTPSPIRAENQRVPSEIAGVEDRQPGDEQRDPDDAAGGAVQAGDPVDDVAGQQRRDHADHRGGDHEQQEEDQLAPVGPGDAEDPAHRALGQLTAGHRRIPPERPHGGHRRHGMTHVHTASFPSTGQHRRRPGCSGGSVSASPVRNRRRAPAAAAPGRPARRRPASAESLRTAERTSAAVARLAPTGAARSAPRPGRRRRRPARRPGRRGWPARSRAPRRPARRGRSGRSPAPGE